MAAPVDPEIAALLGLDSSVTEEKPPSKSGPSDQDGGDGNAPEAAADPVITLSDTLSINPELDKGSAFFEHMVGLTSDQAAKALERNKKIYESTKDREERQAMRQRLTTGFWGLAMDIVEKMGSPSFTDAHRELLRYGLFDPRWIKPELLKQVRDAFAAPQKSPYIHYADEWLFGVSREEIPPSSSDETSFSGKKTLSSEVLNKRQDQLRAELRSAENRATEIKTEEEELQRITKQVIERPVWDRGAEQGLKEPMTSEQRNALVRLQDSAKKLLSLDRPLERTYETITALDEQIEQLKASVEEEGGSVDLGNEMAKVEFMSVRQMVKMSVGRQGNHFPILQNDYISDDTFNWATEEAVLKALEEIERLDPGAFRRVYRGEEYRIHPFILIVPGYGHHGFCWEPFNRHQRATSRARLVIPMMPKDLKGALIRAIGDLRWQIAKEKAQHYWMEEGLTGYYYEYTQNEKVKGDIKMEFVEDYFKWINFESNAVQKLHKDVRPIFWRYTPFPVDVKESLKNRGYYYSELYKKDENIARSDGY